MARPEVLESEVGIALVDVDPPQEVALYGTILVLGEQPVIYLSQGGERPLGIAEFELTTCKIEAFSLPLHAGTLSNSAPIGHNSTVEGTEPLVGLT